jgi:diguanylate cyclase (GGDEF)-like protein
VVESLLGVSRRWIAGLTLAGVACLLLLVLPVDSPAWVLTARGGTAIVLGVFLVAVIRMPRGVRMIWWALWIYAALIYLGDLVYDYQSYVLDEEPFPGWADPIYLLSYVAAFTGLSMLIRRVHSERDREAWIDSAIIVVAAVSLTAVFVIAPMTEGLDGIDLATAVAVAYPLLDLVIIAGLVRLIVGVGRLPLPLSLLTAAFGAYLAGDLVYNASAIYGFEDSTTAITEALFLAAMTLLAAAATAPGAEAIATPTEKARTRPASLRISALTVGVLTAPMLMLLVGWSDGGSLARLLAVATIVVILLALWRIRELLLVVDRQTEQLGRLARTDSLTGLPNRRTLDYELERAVRAADESGSPLTVAMLDLDHFKDYNDENGHQAGDLLLVECARAWSAELTTPAFLARYGGEEFALLLPGLSSTTALPLLERLRSTTRSGSTVSIGVSGHGPGESGYETLRRADLALYEAKESGRDRVVIDPGHDRGESDQSDAAASSATSTSDRSRTSSTSSPA